MRKVIALFALVVVIVTIGSVSASAQVAITLGLPTSGSSGSVTFTGTGSGTDILTFGAGPGNKPGPYWSGDTTGYAGGTSLTSDFWKINFAGTAPVTLNQLTGKISHGVDAILTIGTTVGGSNLLQGRLQLTNLGQLGHTGVFNYDLVANLIVTGGSLLGDFFNNKGVTTITTDITSGKNIFTLEPGQNVIARNPTGWITSTPEPSSMLLFGSGLIVFGGVLRRKVWK